MQNSLPNRSNASRALLGIISVVAASACSVAAQSTYPASAPTRAVADLPDRFLVGTVAAGGPLSDPQADGACRNPVVDPRDGTRLTLVQSQAGEGGHIGDYAVPDGRYGVGAQELLRLDCATGRALGAVPRRVGSARGDD